MQFEPDDEFGWFFLALVAGGVVAALAFFLTKPDPLPAPPNATVFGCYAAARSPPILLDAAGMHVRQAG